LLKLPKLLEKTREISELAFVRSAKNTKNACIKPSRRQHQKKVIQLLAVKGWAFAHPYLLK
jgi:hypothetical protein